jgi:hypothetical protein
MEEAKAEIDAWRVEYSESRPLQARGEITPAYALKCRPSKVRREARAAERQRNRRSEIAARFKTVESQRNE